MGNGVKSIKELLLDFNYNYFKNIEFDNTYDKVLEKDEIFEYNWKFNLSTGATAQILNDKIVEDNLMTIVNQVLSKLNIGFASIDIIKTKDNKYLVMEINSGVMMKNIYHLLDKKIVKDIYKEAILSLFK
jgi:glutathione synthase/RimK-type ligase-like ATP-grasp enzyme